MRRKPEGPPAGDPDVELDITGRKQTEEGLRESEWKLRRLLDANIIGVVTATLDGIIEANDVFLNLVGREREELESGQIDWRAMTPAEHSGKDEAALRQLRDYGRCEPFEKEFLRKDGTRVPILIGATSLKREPLTCMCFVLDLSELKRTEKTLKDLNESLEAQVCERTAVAERRARDLRRLAAELSHAEHRERKRLAKLLHDNLQQMLLAARMRLQYLVEDSEDELSEHAAKIDELLGACLSTSRNLTQELSPTILQYGTLEEVIEWLAEWFAERHDLRVAVNARGSLPPAPEHLGVFLFQAVREMLFNVVKHSGRMEARVGLSFEDGDIIVQVEDEGTGFDPESVQIRLQEPEGFGLFNIRERLEALGGRLEIQKGWRGGACFRVLVPAGKGSEPLLQAEPHTADVVPSQRGRARAERGAVRLLVVDDHRVVREGLIGLLNRQKGLEVIGEAADGREAIRQTEALRPDAVVMDVNMPEMDGIEATRRIKRRQAQTVVVGLSFHEEEATRRAMTEAGADGYVTKDALSKDLIEEIRRACRGS